MLKLLKSKKLSQQNRLQILNSLAEQVTLPIQDIITFDSQGTIQVRGKELTPDQTIQLREGAVALQNNSAYKLIHDQVAFEAIKYGVHSSTSMEMMLLSKSAIWIQEQETALIVKLAGESV